MFKTHFAFGLLIGLLSLNFFIVDPKWLFVLLVAIASSFPDIDHPRSKISKLLFPVSWIISWVASHRGIFHSVFPIIGLYFLFDYIGLSTVGIAIGIGYLSHLIGDALTYNGIDFLYPLSRFKIAGPISTGGLLEMIIYAIIVILDVVLLINNNFINVNFY